MMTGDMVNTQLDVWRSLMFNIIIMTPFVPTRLVIVLGREVFQ